MWTERAHSNFVLLLIPCTFLNCQLYNFPSSEDQIKQVLYHDMVHLNVDITFQPD